MIEHDFLEPERLRFRRRSGNRCRQRLVWVGQPSVLKRENDIVPLVLYPASSVSRQIILQTCARTVTGGRFVLKVRAFPASGQRFFPEWESQLSD
jgi:hypothetical protein